MGNSNKKDKIFHSTEAEDIYLIHLARQQAKKQLEEGTAPPSIVAYYLKLGSAERENDLSKQEVEIRLLEAKRDSLKAAEEQNNLYKEAIEAFKTYGINSED